jgi:glycosyltransferase involved in cell wall biosynthesis
MTGFRWDIPQLIRTFDVFALSSSEEGICGTLLEVAASGCPIVATDVGGVREAVLPEETGIIVPPRSPKSFAQAILRLIENPQDVRRMVRAGRERVVKHFNTDVLAERTLEVNARVLKEQVGQQWPVGFLAD